MTLLYNLLDCPAGNRPVTRIDPRLGAVPEDWLATARSNLEKYLLRMKPAAHIRRHTHRNSGPQKPTFVDWPMGLHFAKSYSTPQSTQSALITTRLRIFQKYAHGWPQIHHPQTATILIASRTPSTSLRRLSDTVNRPGQPRSHGGGVWDHSGQNQSVLRPQGSCSRPVALTPHITMLSSLRAALVALVASAVAANAAPGLSVMTSVPNVEVNGLRNLKVVVTVFNTGDEPLKLLKDPHGVLDSFPAESFTITSAAGVRPLFSGAAVNRPHLVSDKRFADGFGSPF